MEKGILLDLRSIEILSEINVRRLKQYILKKFPGEDEKNRSLVFADAVKKIVGSKIPECDEPVNENLKMQVIRNALKKPAFSVDCSDVFVSVIEMRWQENVLLDSLTKWVSSYLKREIPGDKFRKFLFYVYSNLDKNLDSSIEAIIENAAEEVEEVEKAEVLEEIQSIDEILEADEIQVVEEKQVVQEVGELDKIQEELELQWAGEIPEVEEIRGAGEFREIEEIQRAERIQDVEENPETENIQWAEEIQKVEEVEVTGKLQEAHELQETKSENEVSPVSSWRAGSLLRPTYITKRAFLAFSIYLLLSYCFSLFSFGGAVEVEADNEIYGAVAISTIEEPVRRSVVRKLNMRATAYDLSYESCKKNRDHPEYGITYSGKRAVFGQTVAVDPETIPLGSQLYIVFPKKYSNLNGIYYAEDIGSAVKGDIIDIFLGEDKVGESIIAKEVKEFGVRSVEVYVLREGETPAE